MGHAMGSLRLAYYCVYCRTQTTHKNTQVVSTETSVYSPSITYFNSGIASVAYRTTRVGLLLLC